MYPDARKVVDKEQTEIMTIDGVAAYHTESAGVDTSLDRPASTYSYNLLYFVKIVWVIGGCL